MRFILIFLYLVIVIVSLAFASLNANLVDLNLYWHHLKLPLAFIMISCIGLGLLLGFLVLLGKYWQLRCQYFRVKHQLTMMEKEIKNLRAIPIQDAH